MAKAPTVTERVQAALSWGAGGELEITADGLAQLSDFLGVVTHGPSPQKVGAELYQAILTLQAAGHEAVAAQLVGLVKRVLRGPEQPRRFARFAAGGARREEPLPVPKADAAPSLPTFVRPLRA